MIKKVYIAKKSRTRCYAARVAVSLGTTRTVPLAVAVALREAPVLPDD